VANVKPGDSASTAGPSTEPEDGIQPNLGVSNVDSGRSLKCLAFACRSVDFMD
jgi:hypothetical protein